jgi:hypothetical protein
LNRSWRRRWRWRRGWPRCATYFKGRSTGRRGILADRRRSRRARRRPAVIPDNCFRGRVRRRRRFGLHLFSGLTSGVRIARLCPPVFDCGLGNSLSNLAGPRRLSTPDLRRSHLDHFSPNDRLVRLPRGIKLNLSLQTQTRNRPLAPTPQFVITGTLVYHRHIVVGNIRDVGGSIDDSDILFGRHNRALYPFRAKLRCRHKTVLSGPDVIIVIGPVPNPAAPIELRFRRKRRPPNVVVSLAPGDPCRRPFVARNPNPPDASQRRPTAIMISGPAKPFLRDPGPTRIRVDPVAIRVGTPISGTGFARLPDVSVVARLQPGAVRFQPGIKQIVGIFRVAV